MQPMIGIVGSQGAYGRWLRDFFEQQMGLRVVGRDPADPSSPSERALIDACDVLLFAAPIRQTPALIRHYASLAGARSRDQLWLDVTSVKAAPVAAMLESQADVVGLHPMTAPPKAPTLKGRVLIVTRARLDRWHDWVERLLAALEAECVEATPEQHDRHMALVQAMVHASHLAQASVLAECGSGADALWPFRSVSFELDATIAARILAGNPAIYRDIQFENPAVPGVLDALAATVARLRDAVHAGDDAARVRFNAQLDQARSAFGAEALQAGNYRFEQVGYLLADLVDPHALSVHLPRDAPGALRELLAIFERHGINLASIHSSRTPQGAVHFRIGHGPIAADVLARLIAEIETSGCGHVLRP